MENKVTSLLVKRSMLTPNPLHKTSSYVHFYSLKMKIGKLNFDPSKCFFYPGSIVILPNGEGMSNCSKNLQLLNNSNMDNGRKIDLLVKVPGTENFFVELASTEFKKSGTSVSETNQQQSKNQRTNASILQSFINLTGRENASTVYMDWKGRSGYLVQLFKYKELMISQCLENLLIPARLIELDAFKDTLKVLFAWKHIMINLGNVGMLAEFNEEVAHENKEMCSVPPALAKLSSSAAEDLPSLNTFRTPIVENALVLSLKNRNSSFHSLVF